MAHNAVETQSKLSDNTTLRYYVGPAPHTKQGILLFNPKTKLVVIRRSFQPLDQQDINVPQLQLHVKTNPTQDLSQLDNLITPSVPNIKNQVSQFHNDSSTIESQHLPTLPVSSKCSNQSIPLPPFTSLIVENLNVSQATAETTPNYRPWVVD